MGEEFPWYDSWWLTRYARAKAFIAQREPRRLAEFTAAFDPLRTRPDFDLIVLNEFFTDAEADLIRQASYAIKRNQLEMHEVGTHGRFVVHNHAMLQELHAAVAPLVSRLVGEAVEPAYSFLALYTRTGKCEMHLDAPVSKWTLDYCIDQTEPWPISFSEVIPWPERFIAQDQDWETRIRTSSDHHFTTHTLRPGQAVIFSGSSQWHYRDPMSHPGVNSQSRLLFLHFIPIGTKEIAEWKNWEAHFDIPGLTAAIQ